MKRILIGSMLMIFIVYPLENSTGHENYRETTIKSISRYSVVKYEVNVNSFFQELRVNKEKLELLKETIKSK